MNEWRQIVVGVLLALTVLIQLLCCLGVLRMRDMYKRLHFLGTASLLGGPLIAMAVLVDGSSTQADVKAVTLAAILLLTNPVTSHAIARAARIREGGDAQAGPEEVQHGKPLP